MRRLKKIVISIFLVVIVVFVVANMTLLIFESTFIFKPKKYPLGNWQPVNPPPTDVQIMAKDGTKLHAWYLPHTQPQAVLLYFHGNAGNVTDHYLELVKLHNKLSASVMILDYRGFGKSEGHPTEEAIKQDAEAARDWLANKEHLQSRDIILLGRSLGSGVAIDLAAKSGAKGLILISPFVSLSAAVQDHYPFLFSRILMQNQFDSIHNIPLYHGPLLIIHGDADDIIPLQQGEALFHAANSPKWFVVVPGGKHYDSISDSVYKAMFEFIERIKS
jgi:fermentation-respiration switch protein FrsA (DUF1100 family)